MRTMRSSPTGTKTVFSIFALSVVLACGDRAQSLLAPKDATSSKLDEGAITYYSLLRRNDGALTRGPLHQSATIVDRDGCRKVKVDTAARAALPNWRAMSAERFASMNARSRAMPVT